MPSAARPLDRGTLPLSAQPLAVRAQPEQRDDPVGGNDAAVVDLGAVVCWGRRSVIHGGPDANTDRPVAIAGASITGDAIVGDAMPVAVRAGSRPGSRPFAHAAARSTRSFHSSVLTLSLTDGIPKCCLLAMASAHVNPADGN